eukprot:6205953-Pleurochrysis_carterae.AAC.1
MDEVSPMRAQSAGPHALHGAPSRTQHASPIFEMPKHRLASKCPSIAFCSQVGDAVRRARYSRSMCAVHELGVDLGSPNSNHDTHVLFAFHDESLFPLISARASPCSLASP